MKIPMFLPEYHKGAVLTADGAEIRYVIIGSGPVRVVTIPGAGDGLQTVTDAARSLAWIYRSRRHKYRMIVFSRRHPLPPGFGIERHADDFLFALDQLGWEASIWECNSAGGPIGQWVAVKRPALVNGLVLTATLYRTDAHLRQVLARWLKMIEQNRWADLMLDTIAYTYRPRRAALYRWLKPLLAFSARRRIPGRMENVLRELLELDNSPLLPQIECPTLIIDGAEDRLILQECQREMADQIPNSRLVLCAGYGHGNEIENPAYQDEFDQFAKSVMSKEAV